MKKPVVKKYDSFIALKSSKKRAGKEDANVRLNRDFQAFIQMVRKNLTPKAMG